MNLDELLEHWREWKNSPNKCTCGAGESVGNTMIRICTCNYVRTDIGKFLDWLNSIK